jgi:hypothetical protein
LRFVGPSRAILSPQRSARTCMVEVVSIQAMNGTKPILDAIEMLGEQHGATPHWGMFSTFSAGRVVSAFPRLDTWRRIRFELTAGGILHTFDNEFTRDSGLEDPPSGTPLLFQDQWRWCRRCMSMVYGENQGRCAAGDSHDTTASGNYGFPHNVWSAPGERNWRWCNKCQELVSSDISPKRSGRKLRPCPAGGNHTPGTSDYTVLAQLQAGWRWCSKCQSLARTAAAPCPAGGIHDQMSSGEYFLETIERPDPSAKAWRWCIRCQGLTSGDGQCAGGTVHDRSGTGAYPLALNAPTAPGQAHWRACNKCGTLAYGMGSCFAGGIHDFLGSGDYTLITDALQGAWRRCAYCQSLWFSGAGGPGVCSASTTGHSTGSSEYFVAIR